MAKISEAEFEQICEGIRQDRQEIIKHNPIGTDEEILLWMLLNCLNSYLSLTELEVPCFTDRPDADTYRKAVLFVLKDRKIDDFDPEPHIENLLRQA